jgi:hypothetical protein
MKRIRDWLRGYSTETWVEYKDGILVFQWGTRHDQQWVNGRPIFRTWVQIR